MLKNSKDKNNYVSTEEVEKIYNYQKKVFEEKIEEQEQKIEELVNFISARFGEDIGTSTIADKINTFEKNIKDIEVKNKNGIDNHSKLIKKQIEKETKKLASELNDIQTESYFKLLQKNESDMEKVRSILDEKNNNVSELDKIIQEHIKDNEEYRKEIQKEFKETHQKIDKISYAGITNKFDKKIKEEATKIAKDLNEDIENTANLVGSLDEKLSEEIVITNEKIDSIGNLLEEKIKGVQESINSARSDSDLIENNLTIQLDEIKNEVNDKIKTSTKTIDKISKNIEQIKENIKETKNESKTIEKNVKNQLKDLEQKTSDLYAKFELFGNDDLENTVQEIFQDVENVKTNVTNMDGKLQDNFEDLKKDVKLLNKKIDDKVKELTKNISETQNNEDLKELNLGVESTKLDLINLESKLDEDIDKIRKSVDLQNDKIEDKIEEITASIETSKLDKINLDEKLNEDINKIKKLIKTQNDKFEDKLEDITSNIESSKLDKINLDEKLNEDINKIKKVIKLQNDKIEDKLEEITLNIENTKLDKINLDEILNENIDEIKNNVKTQNEKLIVAINKKLTNYKNENNAEIEKMSQTVDDLKNTMNDFFGSIEQEILNISDEVKTNLEKQNNNSEIEDVKKDYNKYVTKINNEISKISKAVLNVQKKNMESNQNLQVKIKSYIDNKIEKLDNTQNLETIINNIDLALQEREKIQREEMEKLFEKKLKKIQKENERILEEKIKELSSKLIRENVAQTRVKPNNVTIYQEKPRRTKSLYQTINENEMLKRSASSKNPLSTQPESKSQILKFFYDEDE